MTSRLYIGFLTALLCPALALHAQSNRIVEPINPGQAIELSGNVPFDAQPQYDRGPVEPSQNINSIILVLKSSTQQQAQLAALLAAQQNPASPDYHRWLTPAQFADRFGLSQADIDKIADWLRSQGFQITYTANARNWIAFDGAAAQVSRAFRTEIHHYLVDSQTHFANSTAPSIPAAFADVVAGIRGLSDFHPKPLYHFSRPAHNGSPRPNYTDASGNNYLAPDDIATIYDLFPIYNASYDGTGMTLMVMGQTDIATSDISDFRSLFNLSNKLPTLMLVPFSSNPGTTGDVGEADLDLEWTGAVARNATILYVYSTDVATSAQYAIDHAPVLAPVMSYSYGGCEVKNSSFLDSERTLAQQAVAEGITWIASSGDTGAAACDSESAAQAVGGLAVNFPSSIPEITAVGGTEFNEGFGSYWSFFNGANFGSALSYIPEMAWNDTLSRGTLSGGGGGVSIHYPKPAWQNGSGFPSGSFRLVPDVAFTASADHDGYMICTQGSCRNSAQGFTPTGGTSVAAPVFAGIVTLLNQYEVAIGTISKAGLGNINPNLYALAQSAPYPVFHDVTVGNNIVPCQVGTPNCSTGSFGYHAGPGYDQATGLGSVDATNLLVSWAPPPLTISGQVTFSGNGLSGVTMTLSGSKKGTTSTSSTGLYSLNAQTGGTFTVTPSLAGFSFNPSSTTFNNLTTNQTANFTAQCGYSFNPAAPAFDSTAQTATLSLTAGPGCTWTASSTGFITINSGHSGTGNGTIGVSVTANTSGAARTATLTVAGQTVTVTQRATPEIFADVTPSDYYFDFADLMYTANITAGCSTHPLDYCPDSTTTRGEMAVFLIVAIEGGNSFTYTTTPYFTDVPPSNPYFKFIQKLRDLGITGGCTSTTYCPNDSVTRAEMAVFIIVSRYETTAYTYPTTPYFTDVPSSNLFFPFVQKMAQAGITAGCGAGLYCPNSTLTRGQMAVFIVTGLLNELLPAGTPSIASMSPNSAAPGHSVTVTLTGVNTHFAQGTTNVVAPAGVTPSSISVSSGTSLTVHLAVGTGVAPNPTSIVVLTGSEEAVLPNGFLIQ